MSNANNSCIPRLRFPGFEGEWVEKKLGKVCLNEDNRRKPVSKTERILGQYPYYGANGIQDFVNGYIFDGERLLVGEDGSVLTEENTPVVHWATGKFWVNNHAHVLSQKEDDSLKYIYYVLSTKKIAGLVTGIPPKLNQENLNTIILPFPPVLFEQQKIASCLSELDNLIVAQGQKVDALKEKKKGLMQQLFPQPGETTPRLRFPGFEGEWEEKKLGYSFDERTEKNRGELPLLSLGEEGLKLQSETARKDNSNADKSKYLRVAIGDIAYNTMRMWQGRCVCAKIEGIVSPAYTVCRPKNGIDSLFHYYLFKTQRMIQTFHKHSQGLVSDTLNLKFEAFSKIKYCLPPTFLEQQKIASSLSSLDDLIATESAKVEALKDHKKGLMQQLFPQPTK